MVRAVLTFISSSLIFTHGSPLILFSLMTMFSALLFSVPPLDDFLKSFVNDVPMPKEPGQGTDVSGLGLREG